MTLVSMEPLLKYHPWFLAVLTVGRLTGHGTMSGGQFDWGGRLPKSNGGARRSPQPDWKPGGECIGIRELNCKTNKSSRCESRSK